MEIDTIALLFIAVLNAFTGYLAWRTRSDVRVIEKATNSMKDALVAATDVAARAEGKEEGRLEGVAEGARQGQGRVSDPVPVVVVDATNPLDVVVVDKK